MPAQAPTKPPSQPPAGSRPSRGQVTAEGVFAEISTALNSHQQTVAPKLIPPLAERVKNILPSTGVKIKDPQAIEKIVREIATETVTETFENLGKIQDSAQIKEVLTDSLVKSISAHPGINPSLTVPLDEEKIAEKAKNAAAPIAKANLEDLQRAAVLKNLDNLATQNLADTRQIAETEAEKFVFANDLPDAKNATAELTDKAIFFSKIYGDNLQNNISAQIPTLAQLREIKTKTYEQSLATFGKTSSPAQGPSLDPLIENVSHLSGFKPITEDHARKLGVGDAAPKTFVFARAAKGLSNFGMGLAASVNKQAQQEGFFAALAHEPHRLDETLSEKQNKLKEYGKKKTLSYRERKEVLNIQKEVGLLTQAKNFSQKNPHKVQSYISWQIAMSNRQRLDWSKDAWQTYQTSFNFYPGVGVQTIPTRKVASVLPGRFFGAQAVKLGGFAKTTQSALQVGKFAGSEAFMPALVAKKGLGFIRQIGVTAAGYLFGMALYFLALGKAAMTGFLIGAGVGGTIGTIGGALVGFQVALACGPAAPFCAAVTIPTFAFTGGMLGAAIGGTAGALIALGLASGSATMATMGIGGAAGGTVGAVVGFNVGAGIAATVWTAAIGACIGSLVCAPLAPFMIAASPAVVWVGGFLGATAGAFLGALAGATVGYLVGHYVIPAFSNIAIQIKNLFNGALGAGAGASGLFGTIGSFITGLGSTIWGGLATAGGWLGSGFSTVFGALGSHLGIGSTTTFASVGVFGSVGTVGAVAIVGGTITAAAFFNPDPTGTQLVGGENDFFTIAKSADINSVPENNQLPKTVTFRIILTAKDTRLTAISITDQINVAGRRSSFSITPTIIPGCSPPPNLEANTTWECQFRFEIKNDSGQNHIYDDSQVTNTVTVKTTPEGGSQIQDSATAVVTVGNPPTNCPLGWPTTTGYITQGPNGGTSHYRGYPDEQAIDIAGLTTGDPTIATFTGTVLTVNDTNSEHPYGYYVDISGNCNGIAFSARWAHLFSIDSNVHEGEQIRRGNRVGAIDHTGNVDPPGPAGTHLHYSFFGLDMGTPYILQNPSSLDCNGQSACGVSW